MAGRGQAPGPVGAAALGPGWEDGMQAAFLGLRDWRALHATATFAEIEGEVDRRMQQVRAQLLADLALASRAASLTAAARVACSACGTPLHDEGAHERTLGTLGDARVTLRRDYATCPRCRRSFFPSG